MVDYTTPEGQVRLLIPDVVKLVDPRDLQAEPEYIFSDDQIAGFLAIERGNVKRAAASAVDVIATDEALVLKVIKTDDKETDGSKLLKELSVRAARLRADADREELGDTVFDLAEFTFDPRDWAWRA